MMIPYIIASAAWALYAVEMQKKVHGNKPCAVTTCRLVFVLAINAIFCPIAIIVAYRRMYKINQKANKYWEEKENST